MIADIDESQRYVLSSVGNSILVNKTAAKVTCEQAASQGADFFTEVISLTRAVLSALVVSEYESSSLYSAIQMSYLLYLLV